ncbi:hypothetical protein EV361DRAFT_96776 [Lentinula raphanica]|nr:hypothetical protein EV361DRAFT_96776 [Lentinula raphanica]
MRLKISFAFRATLVCLSVVNMLGLSLVLLLLEKLGHTEGISWTVGFLGISVGQILAYHDSLAIETIADQQLWHPWGKMAPFVAEKGSALVKNQFMSRARSRLLLPAIHENGDLQDHH